jgi:hypothetical protein
MVVLARIIVSDFSLLWRVTTVLCVGVITVFRRLLAVGVVESIFANIANVVFVLWRSSTCYERRKQSRDNDWKQSSHFERPIDA